VIIHIHFWFFRLYQFISLESITYISFAKLSMVPRSLGNWIALAFCVRFDGLVANKRPSLGQKRGGKSMSSSFQGVINNVGILVPAAENQRAEYSAIYNQHCHRIYSLAVWMTDNELSAEQLAGHTFLRAFACTGSPSTEQIDQAFLVEIRERILLGDLTLNCVVSSQTKNVYRNMKRVHLERALVQLPATEKLIFLFHDIEGYGHERISFLLGIGEHESQLGLHQARLRIRELVSQMF
jgi:RNA polymerase sigma-70 factor (ECF subfamily)